MNSYRDRLWILLGDWITEAQIKCMEFDTQLTFIRQIFLDYILLIVHYTESTNQ